MDLLPSDPAPAAAADDCVSSGLDPALIDLCVQWSLRMLVDMGGYQDILPDTHCAEPLLLEFVGVPLDADEDYDAQAVLARLRARHREVAARVIDLPGSSPIIMNLEWLGNQLGLSEADRSILLFRVLAELCPQFRAIVEARGDMSTSKVYFFLSSMLELPLDAVQRAFDPTSALARTGILRIDDTLDLSFVCKTDLINGFTECVTQVHGDPFDLFNRSFVRAPRAELALSHFAHLGEKVNHLRAYLDFVMDLSMTGVNILVYGPPGTGKTALVRALAASIKGVELFEIVVRDENGNLVEGQRRLTGYGLSQRVLASHTRAIILFDEIEDMPVTMGGVNGRSENRSMRIKGYLNHMLESNLVPAFFVTNDPSLLDPAHLRRFDYHLKMDIPPAAVRKSMLADHAAPLGVSDAWCARLAENEALAPACMARTAKVARVMRAAGVKTPPERLLEELIEGALTVQEATFRRGPTNGSDLTYRIDSVNADYDLAQLLAGLRETGQARVCLYGPPGTGKSAFAAHVARTLGRPPLLKRASDLLSPYVGQTEQLMAEAFEEAQREGAVLILDEADSFLRTREQAHHAWEVTAVNEMLTQMEAFEGIFFATTNLMAQLDAASLRRFDAKVCFDYLRPEQARTLMLDTARALGIDLGSAPVPNVHARLVPGDFANLLRQARLRPMRSVEDMASRLIDEAKHRTGNGGRAIGFLAAA